MIRPKLVALDTASWDSIARQKTDAASRILNLLAHGSLIPFFTGTHFDELMQHGNRNVVDARQSLLRRLPFVSYIQGREGYNDVGWWLDLCELEMGILCDTHDASADVVLKEAQNRFTTRFCSGAELYERNVEQWEHYRRLEPMFRNTPETASLAQFSLPGVNLDQRIPKATERAVYRSAGEFRRVVASQLDWFAEKLRADGDKRLQDPEKLAAKHLRELIEESEPLLGADGDVIERLLAHSGVERERLPAEATIHDVGYEATFIGHLRVHERRLRLPRGALKQFVRQDQVPSWIVWREVDRAMRRLQKAEGSSLADKWMVPFALYVDRFEVDKRVFHCVRDAARSNPLLRRVQDRLFRRRSMEELAQTLAGFAAK